MADHGESAGRGRFSADPINRRQFLKVIGAATALAGLSACVKEPAEEIVPYVRAPAPERVVPGKPLFYATAVSLSGIGLGVLVESHLGRPIKVEGNPEHPASLGATDAFAQAAVRTLYDPERSQTVTHLGRPSTWGDFVAALRPVLEAQRARQGAGLRVLTETVTSPTLGHQLRALLDRFPAAKWHQYEPVGRGDHARAGARLAFGEVVESLYRVENADVILALDADFLACCPQTLRYVREFARRRRVCEGQARMNRLYTVGSTLSLTAAGADHRLPLRSGEVEGFARAVAAKLGVDVGPGSTEAPRGVPAEWIDALVRDLQRHRGACLVIPGDSQPPAVHALAHAMNHALGNVGQTIVYTEPVEVNPVDQTASLRELVEDIAAGQVEALVIIDSNPVYTAPADVQFAERLEQVPLRAQLSLYADETAALCQWHLPAAHTLESWGDVRAYDGTISIVQPLIQPLYEGKSAHELVALFSDQPDRTGYEIVREYWQSRVSTGDFERFWRQALHDGVIPGTALPPRPVSLRPDWVSRVAGEAGATGESAAETSLEIVFRADPNLYDGRFAENAWLQELPKPITKLSWDNAAFVSPATAERLGLANEDVVELHYQGRMIPAPIWVLPGQADNSVTVHLGYGRTVAGPVGRGVGFNAYALRTSAAPWFDSGLTIRKTGERYQLATTQEHHRMEGRHLVRAGTLQQYRDNPDFAQEIEEVPPASLYPEYLYAGYAWGMAIDLTACTGCNACVVACQAENNIPTVGKEQVRLGREMLWLRVDSYFEGDASNPRTYHQPVPCMHCEKAPCEYVCPVAATVHSEEGLNDMIYNRCVGTRYCSQNCPYKVRRFNYLRYADYGAAASLKMLANPDVTVRSRGVMEKCTYCVQRIREAEIAADKENRPIRDGEILTACQAACPSQAIVFGNINDSNSQVARWKAEPLNYALLGELGTQPRTTYLAALRNPNPEIERPPQGAPGGA